MARLLAIDPGNVNSGYCIIDTETKRPKVFGKAPNRAVLKDIIKDTEFDECVIEMVASYGMPVGATVFETCLWIGRFTQAVEDHFLGCVPVKYLKRQAVKTNLCHSAKAKDSNITQALIDRFDPQATNHGKGTKDSPGWFYGFKSDIWQAYALGITYIDKDMVDNW